MGDNIVPFVRKDDQQGSSLPTAVAWYRKEVGKFFRFSFPVEADGINVGTGERRKCLKFNEGRLIAVLAPSEQFAPKRKGQQRHGSRVVILGCLTGTAVFVGAIDGTSYHFGVDLTDNGVKLIQD